MHPELAALAAEFHDATSRLDALERSLTAAQWSHRPSATRWSPLECVQHLNLTAEATLPRVRAAIERARSAGGTPPARYRMDVVGWLLWNGLRRPGRFKSKTAPAFVPAADRPPAAVCADFRRLQAEHLACVADCERVGVRRATLRSPFNERIGYSVYSALTILAVHQHRHLWQAEQGVV